MMHSIQDSIQFSVVNFVCVLDDQLPNSSQLVMVSTFGLSPT